jgi:hypothetical protein
VGGWTERGGGDGEFAQFDAGGVRRALYPLGLLRDEAVPDSELPPEDAWNGLSESWTRELDSRGGERAAAG